MALGDTIAIRPRQAVGSWSVQTGEFSLDLSARATVRVEGGGLLGAGQDRLLTLELTPRAGGGSLADLRRELALYCRPEAGGLTLTYAGAARTVKMPCAYVEGLDSLRLVLAAKASTWKGVADSITGFVEGTIALNTPTSLVPAGTAGTAPLFQMTYAAGGALEAITNEVVGVYSLSYEIHFGGTQPAAPTTLQIACLEVMVVPQSYLNMLQPGSTFGTFRLIGGVENVLTISGVGLVNLRYSYSPRFWSWEDADV